MPLSEILPSLIAFSAIVGTYTWLDARHQRRQKPSRDNTRRTPHE